MEIPKMYVKSLVTAQGLLKGKIYKVVHDLETEYVIKMNNKECFRNRYLFETVEITGRKTNKGINCN